MAKKYFQKLSDLISKLELKKKSDRSIEVKHFFSGAALYVDGVICATWSPAGLAFKFCEQEVQKLIKNGEAKPLKYFAKGHVKKDYALFEKPEVIPQKQQKKYFLKTIQQ